MEKEIDYSFRLIAPTVDPQEPIDEGKLCELFAPRLDRRFLPAGSIAIRDIRAIRRRKFASLRGGRGRRSAG